MPRFLLKDVNPTALSLVGQGANGKTICLLKSAAAAKPQLTARQRIVKTADWSVFYCVVAEPDAVENGGILASPDTEDVWASAEEIRKAAHAFMENGGIINREHDDVLNGGELEAYGQLVENAIALNDISVPQADGSVEVIKEGSWYIAVKPTDEGKAAIEAGDFTGVSLQGTGVRLPADDESAGLIAKLREILGGAPAAAPAPPEAVAKAIDDFAARQAKGEFSEELYDAMWHLEDVLWSAIYQWGDEQEDPVPVVSRSIDQFKDWALAHVQKLAPAEAVAKAADGRGQLAWRLPTGSTLVAKSENPRQEAGEVTPAEAEAAIRELKETQKETTEALGTIAELVKGLSDRIPEPEPKEPTPAELQEQLGQVVDSVAAIAKAVNRLGDGDTTQDDEPSPTRLAKTFDPDKPLRGIL